MNQTLKDRKNKLQEKKEVLKILISTNNKIQLEINKENKKYFSELNKETKDKLNNIKYQNIEKIKKRHYKIYSELNYGLENGNILVSNENTTNFNVLGIKEFEKEIEKEEDKIFQQKILIQNSKDNKIQNRNNNIIANFTMILAFGVIFEIIKELVNTYNPIQELKIIIYSTYLISVSVMAFVIILHQLNIKIK